MTFTFTDAMQAVLKFALGGTTARRDPPESVQSLRARAEGLKKLREDCSLAYSARNFTDWQKILARLPVSAADYKASFPDAPDPREVRTRLRTWMQEFSSKPAAYQARYTQVHAFLGVLLLTWYGLRYSELLRSGLEGQGVVDASVTREDCEAAAVDLVACPEVAEALIHVYAVHLHVPLQHSHLPDAQTWTELVEAWEYNVRPDGLSFHKYGTTSLILKRDISGTRIAVKLVLLPYAALPAVAQSTRDYFSEYNHLAAVRPGEEGRDHLVRVMASFDRWVIMNFVDGKNLGELLAAPEAITAKILHPRLGFTGALREELFQHSRRSADVASSSLDRRTLSNWSFERLVAEFRRRLHEEGTSAEAYLRSKDDHASELAVFVQRLQMLGKPVFAALIELERAGETRPGSPVRKTSHNDLTPSNIIVDIDSHQEAVEMTLIDFGKNHLHTRLIAGRLGRDASYVAPEVLEDRQSPGPGSADLYSLGQLLIASTGVDVADDGAVPDSLYASTPLVARFLEDFVQRNPADRLRLFRPDRLPTSAGVYDGLDRYFDNELDAVERALEGDRFFSRDRLTEVVSGSDVASTLLNVVRPLSGAPQRQLRLSREIRAQIEAGVRPEGDGSRKLAFWSMVSASANAVAFAALSLYVLRDLHQDWSIQLFKWLQRARGAGDEDFPLLDAFRVPGYDLGDWRRNGPTWLVCGSYIILSARYYQALYAGLNPTQGATRIREVGAWGCAAEFFMRAHTLIGPVLALVMILRDSSLWHIATFIGQTAVLLCNASVGHFMKYSFEDAQYYRRKGGHLSTVPLDKTRITGYSPYFGWWKSGIFYSSVILGISLGLSHGYLHDDWTYASMVAGINVFSFYLVKVGTDAPEVRIALARACLAAERMRVMRRDGLLAPRRTS